MNSEEVSFELRKKLNQQTLQHSVMLRNLIEKKKRFIPSAFHFLPIDYVILNSPSYEEFLTSLKKLEQTDPGFRASLQQDAMGREYTDANISFLLEEIAISHILRQRLVELPRTLTKNDSWRLIVYPGSYINGDLYQWKKKILPQKDKINPYAGATYDYKEKKLFVFDDMNQE